MADLDLNGHTLAKYLIEREIGRGGMGAVYAGRDTVLERPVAFKVLAPHLVWDRTFVQRFRHEARTAAQLDHPHIVTIYDVGEQNGLHFLVISFFT
jgi:serine/threonine-protein kinase